MLKPKMDRALWRWVRRWVAECDLERYRINKARMQRVAFYSRDIMELLREHYQLDYEQTSGVLQLFRTGDDIRLAQPGCDMLAENGIPHEIMDADGARKIEPSLGYRAELAGALYLPDDESGNCPLFVKRMRQVAQSIGVHFHFSSTVRSIASEGGRVALHIDDREFSADAVVLAAGVDSADLLKPLGIQVPLYPVKGYSATAAIRNFEDAPRASVIDEQYKTSISRMGNRIRIAGIAELGSNTEEMKEAAMRTLIKVGSDWFPNAANYNTASFWCGARPTLPDGAPLLGATPVRNVYVNIGHGSYGWAMAAGSGKVLADIISDRVPDIDMDGLTLSRYG
jgi:D-amino-acid dehydrogenase